MIMETSVFNFEDFLGKSKNIVQEKNIKPEIEELVSDITDDELSQDVVEELTEEEPSYIEEEKVEKIIEEKKLNESYSSKEDDNYYSLYSDKSEVFSCDIMVEGADVDETLVRLIIETDDWTLMFPGQIESGKVNIPIRKLSIFKEGEIGKIKLEVIAEGTQFIPWEDDFKVKRSKSVQVSFNEKKQTKQLQTPKTKVNVRLRN